MMLTQPNAVHNVHFHIYSHAPNLNMIHHPASMFLVIEFVYCQLTLTGNCVGHAVAVCVLTKPSHSQCI
jgi:hypothetical protein